MKVRWLNFIGSHPGLQRLRIETNVWDIREEIYRVSKGPELILNFI